MKGKKRLLAICFAAFVLVLALGMSAFAEYEIRLDPDTLWAGCEYTYGAHFINMPENAKIVSIKSSKPSVIQATKTGSGIYDTNLTPLKVGKSKITVTYKLNGEKKKISAYYTVKKYPSPYSYIKVNGKKIDIKNHKYYFDINKYTKTSAKIEIKLKKGWKIRDAYGYDGNGKNEFTPKNGKSFKIKKGKNAYVFFNVQKGNDVLQYGIRFYRK